ncbi:hypothetical protein F5B19DRAFT_449505 [Rostrohypoxylon terebratum]|nr:hypothetical protein F5B19DRAFT_449505 [Rostrohypoxylon terebratum]
MERLRKSRTRSVGQTSWPGSSRRPSKSSLRQQLKTQQQVEQASHPLPEKASMSNGSSSESTVKQGISDNGDLAIVRTTQFTADESYSSDIAGEQYQR